MNVVVPYGAYGPDTCRACGEPVALGSPFILAAEQREMAAYYGVTNWRRLRRPSTDGRVALARDALTWRLIQKRGFTQQRAGELMNVSAKSAREAAGRHQHRIAQFRSQFRVNQGATDAA